MLDFTQTTVYVKIVMSKISSGVAGARKCCHTRIADYAWTKVFILYPCHAMYVSFYVCSGLRGWKAEAVMTAGPAGILYNMDSKGPHIHTHLQSYKNRKVG